MSEQNQTPVGSRPSSHDLLWWLLLLPLLAANLLVGFVIVVSRPEFYALLFAVGAFSIAYALHILSVSGALCGVQIHELNESKFQKLRDLEYRIVTYGMCVVGGGLAIVLSGSLCAFKSSFAICIYSAGAVFQLFGVLGYVLFERRWADKVRSIRHDPS